jgi:hypothetical protein
MTMIERAIREAMDKLGGRAEALGRCPVCGRKVRRGQGHVRAWSGKYAHSRCASYERRSPRRGSQRGSRDSHRVHRKFTPA